MVTRGPMMEAFLALRIPEELSPPPDLTNRPEPQQPVQAERPPPPRYLRSCFYVLRTIFWFNVAVLLYASVAVAPAVLRHLHESQPERTLEEIRISATFWYIMLIAAPIVVVYYTHNVRRWLR